MAREIPREESTALRLLCRTFVKSVALALVLVLTVPRLTAMAGPGSSGSSGGATTPTTAVITTGAPAPATASSPSGTSGYQNTSAFLHLNRRSLFVLVYGPD